MIKCLVIGGGPAGLMSAISFAENIAHTESYHIKIIDHAKNIGQKLLITGNSRCNLTNVLATDEFISYGFSQNQQRFIKNAIYEFSPQNLVDFTENNGVKLICHDNFHYFPQSQKSSDILNMLLKKINSNSNIKIVTNQEIDEFIIENDKIVAIKIGQQIDNFDVIIVATGGASYPNSGSNGTIFPLLEKINHTIIPLVPALVGVQIKEKQFNSLVGNVLHNSQIYIDLKNFKKQKDVGELLFTHHGLSGPAILDLSGKINRLLLDGISAIPIRINLNCDYDTFFWQKTFANERKKNGKRQIRTILHEYFIQKLVDLILDETSINFDRKIAELSALEQENLINNLISLKLNIIDNEGFKRAIVTSGGVKLSEINRNSMQSKIINNLFFAGEVIDIDGRCGGYNLTWAFASGKLAGKSASQIFAALS